MFHFILRFRFSLLLALVICWPDSGRFCHSCNDWVCGGQAIPHRPNFTLQAHLCPELDRLPEATLMGPAAPNTNCFGYALYAQYRQIHPEGLFLSDRAAEMVVNARYRRLHPEESAGRGDLVAYLQHRTAADDPSRTIRALQHLAVVWGSRRGQLMVLTKFDSGPVYILPASQLPRSYPRFDELVILREINSVGSSLPADLS